MHTRYDYRVWSHHTNWLKRAIIGSRYSFKNGPSKICGGQPIKNLKWYGLLESLDPPKSSIVDLWHDSAYTSFSSSSSNCHRRILLTDRLCKLKVRWIWHVTFLLYMHAYLASHKCLLAFIWQFLYPWYLK